MEQLKRQQQQEAEAERVAPPFCESSTGCVVSVLAVAIRSL